MTIKHLSEELIQLRKRNEELEISEQLYKILFENTDDGFENIEPIYDESNKICDYSWIKVNNAWEKQVGLKAADVVGKRATEVFLCVEDYWLEKYDRIIKSGKSERYEIYGEETKRWFDCHCFPYAEGRLGVIFRDITKKKQAENTLKEREQLYRTLFENTEDAFQINEFIYDEFGKVIDYKIIEVNSAFEKKTGLKAADVIGKLATSVFSRDLSYRLEIFDKIKNSCKDVRYEYYYEDTKRWYDILCFPYTKGLVGELFRDVTESKEYERKLTESEHKAKELIVKLRRVDENKNEFLNMLSHEIRNPMAAVMLNISLLENIDPNSVQAAKAKDSMKRQLKHLSDLVDDLLDVTRINNNKVKLKKEHLEINELVQNAVLDHKDQFNNKNVSLTFQSSSTPLYIEADNVRLMQVMDNLLNNAVKFTQSGDITTLKVERDEIKNEVLITISDTGIGIAKELQSRLFDPFTQVDNSLDRSSGGLGLGLAIVKGMVELHGGSVEVFSEGIGKGSQFTIRLPLLDEKVEEKVDIPVKEKTLSKTLNILMIDDSNDLTEIMCELIGFLGHKGESASNGMDGILKAKELHPDVIICDIGLPVMNGYEVAKNIRNDIDLNEIYLIALSGYGQQEDIERSIKAGFNIHLAKPLSLDTLKKVLDEIHI